MIGRIYSFLDHRLPIVLEPLDLAGRIATGRWRFPPRRLRREVGPLQSFESSAGEFIAYLKLLTGLSNESHVLDIGCGCGLIPLHLDGRKSNGSGSYVGIDVEPRLISWCEKNIASGSRRFVLADLKSERYNSSGTYDASDYRFPFEDETFDIILLKSVFTHLNPDATRNYLREIQRMLKVDGRCLATFFLLNGRGTGPFHLPHGDADFRYENASIPEEICAHSERWLLATVAETGLAVEHPVYYGTWANEKGMSFQDIVVFSAS